MLFPYAPTAEPLSDDVRHDVIGRGGGGRRGASRGVVGRGGAEDRGPTHSGGLAVGRAQDGGLRAFEIEIFLGRLLEGGSFFVVHCCPCLQVPAGLTGTPTEDSRGKRGASMAHHSRVSVESQ